MKECDFTWYLLLPLALLRRTLHMMTRNAARHEKKRIAMKRPFEISSGDGDWEINRRGLREKVSTQFRKIMTFARLRVFWVRRVLC